MKFHTVEDLITEFKEESAKTVAVFNTLTPKSLNHPVAPGDRTIGEIAWHMIEAYPKILSQIGLTLRDIPPRQSDPQTLTSSYQTIVTEFLTATKTSWQDADLITECDVYTHRWTRGYTVGVLLFHEVHHRGQLTILMRQAGLQPPDTYGPAGRQKANEQTGE